jgi:hypothetical protein
MAVGYRLNFRWPAYSAHIPKLLLSWIPATNSTTVYAMLYREATRGRTCQCKSGKSPANGFVLVRYCTVSVNGIV